MMKIVMVRLVLDSACVGISATGFVDCVWRLGSLAHACVLSGNYEYNRRWIGSEMTRDSSVNYKIMHSQSWNRAYKLHLGCEIYENGWSPVPFEIGSYFDSGDCIWDLYGRRMETEIACLRVKIAHMLPEGNRRTFCDNAEHLFFQEFLVCKWRCDKVEKW